MIRAGTGLVTLVRRTRGPVGTRLATLAREIRGPVETGLVTLAQAAPAQATPAQATPALAPGEVARVARRPVGVEGGASRTL